jgi:hypothetical protein
VHLDNYGLLREDVYNYLHTIDRPYDIEMIRMLDSFKSREIPIFERFKNFNTLEESFCLEITGWSKEQLRRFSLYLTSTKRSPTRNKIQLIALYRFWLRKGTDQKTLAKMFSERTSQENISKYLSQIRQAIYLEFVPFYLGANKPREFYLRHNTPMTNRLFNLKDDELAIVVDGTYGRCEKSGNNRFQYASWSAQKQDNLIKPFLICCANGYIIDCYGPFAANKNDAKIFEYILDRDIDLQRILESEKTSVFLDRGKDLIKKLISDN